MDTDIDPIRERYRTHTQIREGGALGNLAEGIEIETHNIPTRLIAWPGNGFQTMSVHVLTVPPGQKSDRWTYDMAEEAMVCFKGKGSVLVHGKSVKVEPGDIAYYPAGVDRELDNRNGKEDFVVVTCITPPQFDLYEPDGFYDATNKVMNFGAIEYAKMNVKRVELAADNEMAYHDANPDYRAWKLTNDEIWKKGALFNAFRGGELKGLVEGGQAGGGKSSMLLILFAGFGTGNTGFNFACMTPGMTADIHTHPVSDECVINWWGGNPVWLGDGWHQSHSYDCVLAPSGVRHGALIPRDAKDYLLVGGMAAPPQLDLLINSGYYEDGRFDRPSFTYLAVPEDSSGTVVADD
ncbi:MAG TPA: cupin domain-containing protein [Longimicrobium sp.]|nr:cupin domain-containing protein [Longimicrobium sp.]